MSGLIDGRVINVDALEAYIAERLGGTWASITEDVSPIRMESNQGDVVDVYCVNHNGSDRVEVRVTVITPGPLTAHLRGAQ